MCAETAVAGKVLGDGLFGSPFFALPPSLPPRHGVKGVFVRPSQRERMSPQESTLSA